MDSPSSFHTAYSSPQDSMSVDSRDTVTDITEKAKLKEYRPAMQISREIRQHCNVYLDERLYVNALTFLAHIVSSGASTSTSDARAALVPIPKHIEIASTLFVHPNYTTRAAPEEREIPSLALTLLRNLLATVGPINAAFEEAFAFEVGVRGPRRSRNTLEVDEWDGSDKGNSSPTIKGTVSQKGLWRSARDIWQIVGWAFNCSVCHSKRWKYWKVCLEFLLDVLDADWIERERLDEEREGKKPLEYKMLRESLLMQYLSDVQGRSAAIKRVVKAAFADGSPESLRAYPEVFDNEIKDIKPKGGQKGKWGVGLDDLPYAEYESESGFGSSPLRESPGPQQDIGEPETSILGGPEAIFLRQRILALLSRVSARFPDAFGSLTMVYDLYYISLKPLPVPQFSQFLSPSQSNPIPEKALNSIVQLICVRLLSNSAPASCNINHQVDDELLQEDLEKSYLSWPANTSSVEDNAKLSVVLEILFRLHAKVAKHTPELDNAIEKGIEARERSVSRTDKRKKDKLFKKEDPALVWMRASAQRLRTLLSLVGSRNDCSQ